MSSESLVGIPFRFSFSLDSYAKNERVREREGGAQKWSSFAHPKTGSGQRIPSVASWLNRGLCWPSLILTENPANFIEKLVQLLHSPGRIDERSDPWVIVIQL
jgi:hypothetical protein